MHLRSPKSIVRGRRPSWLMPLMVFVIVAGAFGGLHAVDRQHEIDEIRLQTSITAEQVAIRLQYYLEVRLAEIDILRKMFAEGRVRNEAHFRALADEVLISFSDIQSVNWVDGDGRIRWIQPESGNLAAKGALLRSHPVAGPILADIDRMGASKATPPVELIQGKRGVVAYFPIRGDGPAARRGYVSVVFRLRPIITGCLGADVPANFFYEIRDENRLVLATGRADAAVEDLFAACSLRFLDRTWRLSLAPRPHVVALHHDLAGWGVLALGLALGLTLAWDRWRLSFGRRSLETRTAELLAIYQAYPDIQIRVRADGTVLDCQSSLQSRLYLSPDRFLGRRLQDVLPGPIAGRFLEAIRRVAAEGDLVQFEYALDFEDGAEHYEARVVLLNPGELIVIAREITERKRAEHRQKLMMDELDHRVKNTIASILSLHEQTLASSDSMATYRDRFTDRLLAMARTHEALASAKWTGVSVRRLLRETLFAHVGENHARIRLAGDDVVLPARLSSVLCLVLHELTTNAVKYGSLSTAAGLVDIAWMRRAPSGPLELRWTERGGPAVTAPPKRGVGTSIIVGLVEFQLGGAADLAFPRQGMTAVLTLPIGDEHRDPRQFSSPVAAEDAAHAVTTGV